MADQFNIMHTELRSVKLIFFLIYNELCRGGIKAFNELQLGLYKKFQNALNKHLNLHIFYR